MSIETRFEFPGFAATANQDTPTHQVEVGVIEDGGNAFVLHMIRNKEYAFLNFAVAKIFDAKDEQLWTFQQAQFDGVGLLAKADDITVIALVGKGKFGQVERVIPLHSLVGHQPLGIRTRIQLKKAAANFLDRDYILSHTEENIDRKDQEVARLAARAAEEAAREAKASQLLQEAAAQEEAKRERERIRLERIQTLLARGKITGYTADGQLRSGFPVTSTEWQSCSNGVHVILVDSIGKDGTPGTMLESFKVVKEPGRNPKKGNLATVTAQKHSRTDACTITFPPIRVTMIEMGDDFFEVGLYPSMDAIRLARANGLNSGSYVAVLEQDEKKKILVYSVRSDGIDTIGKFLPLA